MGLYFIPNKTVFQNRFKKHSFLILANCGDDFEQPFISNFHFSEYQNQSEILKKKRTFYIQIDRFIFINNRSNVIYRLATNIQFFPKKIMGCFPISDSCSQSPSHVNVSPRTKRSPRKSPSPKRWFEGGWSQSTIEQRILQVISIIRTWPNYQNELENSEWEIASERELLLHFNSKFFHFSMKKATNPEKINGLFL